MLLTSPLATNQVFATHLSEDLKWQLVYLSSEPACSNYHLQMTNTYFGVTDQYLDLYQVENSEYDPLCMPESKYLSDYQSPHDLDLIVLVYDRNLGEKELHANKMGGLYSHTGLDRTNNHVIILCDCSNFYYSNPVWILSHELSHMILYYKDYEMSVIEDLIHQNDEKYDQCQETYSDTCNSIKTKISPLDGGYAYSVMPVYKSTIKADTQNKKQNQNAVSDLVLDLSKMITKWWTVGKITDGDYANAVGYVVDNSVLSSHDNSKLIMADEPLDDAKTWDELLEEITPEYWDRPAKVEENTNDVLSKVPSNFLTVNEQEISDDVILGLPDWFKNTAKWWSKGKITDNEFKKNVEFLVKKGIVHSQTSKVIQTLIKEVETSPDTKTINNQEKLKNSKTVNNQKQSKNTKTITDLVEDVKVLIDSKELKQKYSKSLVTLLDRANSQFENYKFEQSCKTLNNSINQVNTLVKQNKLDQGTAEELINSIKKTKQNYSC